MFSVSFPGQRKIWLIWAQQRTCLCSVVALVHIKQRNDYFKCLINMMSLFCNFVYKISIKSEHFSNWLVGTSNCIKTRDIWWQGEIKTERSKSSYLGCWNQKISFNCVLHKLSSHFLMWINVLCVTCQVERYSFY